MAGRYVTLGDGWRVTLGSYVRVVKAAKASPDRRFTRGLSDGWPETGAKIVREFREGVHDRINQAIPCLLRGVR